MVALLRVDAPRSLFVHQSPGGYLHRVGSNKHQMPSDYLARLFQQRSQTRLIRFDEQITATATLQDLEAPLWERFVTLRTRDTAADLLQKLGMTRRDEDGELRPTIAGVLLGMREPHRFLPNAHIQAVAYRGLTIRSDDNSLYQRDTHDITGPLEEQIMAAMDFMRRSWTSAGKAFR